MDPLAKDAIHGPATELEILGLEPGNFHLKNYFGDCYAY